MQIAEELPHALVSKLLKHAKSKEKKKL